MHVPSYLDPLPSLFSNAWAPLQELLVTGLENTGDPEASSMALELARKWVKQNWLSYKQSGGAMFEKYDVTKVRTQRGLLPL